MIGVLRRGRAYRMYQKDGVPLPFECGHSRIHASEPVIDTTRAVLTLGAFT